MRNPLTRRLPREFCQDLGKYLVIFLFMILLIGAVSGFLVTDNSFEEIYNQGFSKQKIEDGHISFKHPLPQEVREELEKKGNISLYDLYYFEETIKDTEKNIRVYQTEREVNLLYLMSGSYPEKDNEIALDRMFADNNHIRPGDTITLGEKELMVSGLIAAPDYSCLFEKNADTMFDSINFSIAAMTREGFEKFQSHHVTYNYAWLYPTPIKRTDKTTAKQKSDDLIETLEDVLTDYNTAIMRTSITSAIGMLFSQELSSLYLDLFSDSDTEFVELTDYLPRYLNRAINFTGDDMSSDKASFLFFDYVLTLILAFVFSITIGSTISSEAGVIGTLRASGYTRVELISHYMILPVSVSVAAAILGNILGYTFFTGFFLDIYYGSYSFPPFEAVWNSDAFLLTTVIPLVLIIVINLVSLIHVLKLSPLRFLRHDLSRRGKKKSFYLNKKIPFIHRFRIRIIFQNIPNYLTMFLGIFIGGVLLVFGTMFGPLLDDYKDMIVADRICDYQYVLMQEQETGHAQAEKYILTSLNTTNEHYVEDEVSIFGIVADSSYVNADVSDKNIAVSSALAEKYGYHTGDSFQLKDPYNSAKRYDFTVDSIYPYSSTMAVFLSKHTFAEMFGGSENDFTGYFSNEELNDLDDRYIAAKITTSDLTKASDQLTVSMGNMMYLLKIFGVIVFILLMFIMSKQIIEKNAASISMTKILGFTDGEIGKLYIIATSVVVVISLLITVPLIDVTLRQIFTSYLYTEMSGYIPYIVSKNCFVSMIIIGMICYGLIAVIQMFKIGRISKSDALKNNME